MINVVLAPGDSVEVTLKDTDGTFRITYGPVKLTVRVDMADTKGRKGVIYEERYNDHAAFAEIDYTKHH